MMTWDSLTKVQKSLIAIIMFVALLGGIYYFIAVPLFQHTMKPGFFRAEYHYDLKISVNGATISNVTFFIPIPTRNRTPRIGSIFLSQSTFDKDNIQASIVNKNGSWYLKLMAENIQPSREEFDYYNDLYDNQDYPGLPYLVNTRFPLENESVFLPKTNVTYQYPVPEMTTRFGAQTYNPVISNYQIPVYADYTIRNRVNGIRVEIVSSIQCLNSWVEQIDSWRRNEYTDDFALSLYEEAHGWYLADGTLETGKGIYLDRNAFTANNNFIGD